MMKDTKLNFKVDKRFEQTFCQRLTSGPMLYIHSGELLFCSYGTGMEPRASHVPGKHVAPELHLSSSSLSHGGWHRDAASRPAELKSERPFSHERRTPETKAERWVSGNHTDARGLLEVTEVSGDWIAAIVIKTYRS